MSAHESDAYTDKDIYIHTHRHTYAHVCISYITPQNLEEIHTRGSATTCMYMYVYMYIIYIHIQAHCTFYAHKHTPSHRVDPEFTAIETRYGSGYRWNVS